MSKIHDFLKGYKGDHPKLDETLVHPKMDPKFKLLDLQDPNISYDAEQHAVVTSGGIIPVQPEFADYMQQFGDQVRFITQNGTPWLTAEQREDDNLQKQEYFAALKSGPKQDLAIVNWTKTIAQKYQSGHAAVSVGHLELGEMNPAHEPPSQQIEGYQSEASGSYYPFARAFPLLDRASIKQDMGDAREKRQVVAENNGAHAVGMKTHNSVLPVAGAAAAGILGERLANRLTRRFGNSPVRGTIRAATAAGSAYLTGRITGLLQSAPGNVRMKEEKKGHGVLATLITPAQCDVLSHALMGLHSSYHENYNIVTHNCADFAEEMMSFIGLETRQMVQNAMDNEPPMKHLARRVAKNMTIPSHIRPDRHQWAAHKLNQGDTSIITMEGTETNVQGQEVPVSQDVELRRLEISGQSAVLLEAQDGDYLKGGKPLEVLSKALKQGLELSPVQGRKGTEFIFGNEVQKFQENASLSR